VTVPGGSVRHEQTVKRLRELHNYADEVDRPRAALLLGLAVADLVAELAEDDPRRGTLAEEGLSRLAESADVSPAVVTATELLRECVRLTAADEAAQGPESVRLEGGDLNWDVDWQALRGPAEAGRNLASMLPYLASMLPPQDPTRHALTSITDVLRAFEQGQWSPEHDAALTTAIAQVDAAGLGVGLGLMLRIVAIFIKARRCQQVRQDGGEPDWPSPAELDVLIEDLESADELLGGLGPPFEVVEGLHHLFVAFVIMLRIQVGIQKRDERRDAAWRDRILRLLDGANDHLRQAPSAYAGTAQTLRGKLAEVFAILSQATVAPGSPPAPARAPAPPPAASPASAPSTTSARLSSSAPLPSAVTAEPPWIDPAMGHLSQPTLAGMRILAEQADGPVPKAVTALLFFMDAVNSRKWTQEHADRTAELEREASRLAEEGESPRDHAVVAGAVAMAHAIRSRQQSISPRPQDHSSADELAATAAETESALELIGQAIAERPDKMLDGMAASLRGLAATQLVDLSWLDSANRAELLARARAHFGQLPASMLDQFPVLGNLFVLQQVIEGITPPDDEAVTSVIDLSPNTWDQTGGNLRRAMLAADRAGQSETPEDIGTALLELQTVWLGLSAGSPKRARVLISMARMHSLLALQAGRRLSVGAGIAITAVRAATEPGELRAAALLLVSAFSLMLSRGEREGPFEEAEETLRTALERVPSGDRTLRTMVMTAINAAATMRAVSCDDEAPRVAARLAIAEAERTLPEPTPTDDWCAAARVLCTWTGTQGIYLRDSESALLAYRLIDMIEAVLVSSPELAGSPASGAELERLRQLRQQLQAALEQPGEEPQTADPVMQEQVSQRQAPATEDVRVTARRGLDQAAAALGLGDGGKRRPLAAVGRPEPETIRPIAEDLHGALASLASDRRLRQRVEQMLGFCQAELYWAGAAQDGAQTLRDAVVHLNSALLAGEHAFPTAAWADTLDVLAQCLREASRLYDDAPPSGMAERVLRAALRELADCVMIAESTDQAVTLAARANEIVAQAIGWCLIDSRPRAAIDIAETGRGLVLASVVASGRAEEILRGVDRPDAADAWRAGSEDGRAAALAALRETAAGHALLSTPIGEQISLDMTGTRFDAVVYLVPPAELGGAADAANTGLVGHAILMRPVLGQVEVVPLPGLADATGQAPLTKYLAALDRALAEHDPTTTGAGGFRGQPGGQAWADSLDEVGRWAYARILGPLLEHVRGWSLDRLPHLALIPIGELGAIPYAAAWTDGPPGNGRRYAIDEVVLSYAASARLLGEVARRPRQSLSERVVLLSDPTGEFPMIRRATRLVASRQYPGAEVYGRMPQRHGQATSAALLGALPTRDRPGASLLQLSTHGTITPVPALEVSDGWLPLASILEQARDRAPDAPGGLVITNACLTDITRTHYDESLTLATAFLAVGATAVIGTRWPVDDDTAAIMCLRMHYYLQVGCDPAQALRRAQLDLLRPSPGMRNTLDPHLAATDDGRLSHPASWAGHVHHGI
jgi:CHAT domain